MDPTNPPAHLTPAAVEVWCASLQRWVRGFEVVGSGPEGHVLRRWSDGHVLPVTFSPTDVRDLADPSSSPAGA